MKLQLIALDFTVLNIAPDRHHFSTSMKTVILSFNHFNIMGLDLIQRKHLRFFIVQSSIFSVLQDGFTQPAEGEVLEEEPEEYWGFHVPAFFLR